MKKQGTRRLIIFTDLDGTLLNHGDYSWETPGLRWRKIREAGIPLVICTSKTRREVENVRIELGISSPFIAENGGGIFFPAGHEDLSRGQAVVMDDALCIPLGKPYGMIRAFMEQAGKDCGARGFGDMSVEEVSERTGLPLEKAALAKARDFTEPFVMGAPTDRRHWEEAAARARITRAAGSTLMVSGRQGAAVWLLTEISPERQESVTTPRLRRRPNDFPA
jgi:mannosyl-3-phosphoglycerate phosphatase